MLAGKIAGMSPDSVIVTRHGVREGWGGGSGTYSTYLLFGPFNPKYTFRISLIRVIFHLQQTCIAMDEMVFPI